MTRAARSDRLDPIGSHRETPGMDPTPAPLVPQDGWHCLHLFYRIEYGQWQLLNTAEQRAAKRALRLVQETARSNPLSCSLSQVTPKADLGFMLIRPTCRSRTGSKTAFPVVRRRRPRAGLQLPSSPEREYTRPTAIRRNARDRAELTRTPEFEAAMQGFASGWKNTGTSGSIRRCPTGRWSVSQHDQARRKHNWYCSHSKSAGR